MSLYSSLKCDIAIDLKSHAFLYKSRNFYNIHFILNKSYNFYFDELKNLQSYKIKIITHSTDIAIYTALLFY